MNAFIYEPHVPKTLSYRPDERWFMGLTQEKWLKPATSSEGVNSEMLSVSRSANLNRAEFRFEWDFELPWAGISIPLYLTTGELRDLAQRLLDAAHDIDTNPAPQTDVKNNGETA